jgi:hypothetical protein
MGAFELAVFGTEDRAEIDDRLRSACHATLRADVEHVAWLTVSVAAVAGLELRDGTTVVGRAYQPNVTSRFLEAVIRVQTAARRAGLPAPEPLGPPITLPWGLMRFERLLDDAGLRRFDDQELDLSAAALAAQVRAASEVDPAGLEDHPMAPTDRLYPAPHSPIFDFEATAAGAEWIDEIADAARSARDRDTSRAIVHSDWSARNIRIVDGRLTAVFDWESAEWGPETSGVGVAAATWRSVGEAGEPLAPDGAELQRYLAAYERHRGAPFTPVQRRAALGAAVYTYAYTARCEHSLVPEGREGRARARLDRDGAALLAMLDAG